MGDPNIQKLGKFGKLQIVIKVVWNIDSHIRSLIWQPSSIIKNSANQNRKFDALDIFYVSLLTDRGGKL